MTAIALLGDFAPPEQRGKHKGRQAFAVSVRLHHSGPQGAKPKAEVVADLLANIRKRRA